MDRWQNVLDWQVRDRLKVKVNASNCPNGSVAMGVTWPDLTWPDLTWELKLINTREEISTKNVEENFELLTLKYKIAVCMTCSLFINFRPKVNYEELARCTDDFNGAMLKAVCVEAVSLLIISVFVNCKFISYCTTSISVPANALISRCLCCPILLGYDCSATWSYWVGAWRLHGRWDSFVNCLHYG